MKKSYKAYSDSTYLRKEDFPEPETLTICEVREEEVTAPGKEPKLKVVIYFEERQKGCVLNLTNGLVLELMTGTADPSKWVGVRVRVFNDPTVAFGGQPTGGIRFASPVRRPVLPHRDEPIESSPAPAKPVLRSSLDDDDDVREAKRQARRETEAQQVRVQELERELEAIKQKMVAGKTDSVRAAAEGTVEIETDEDGVPY